MKIDNLYEGQVIKNYKELCGLLEEKVANGGRNKNLQLKEFERYFSYHKEGNKFIIDEIYKEPKQKVENRGTNGKYSDDIQVLILNLLAQSKDKCVLLSTGQLFKKLNMTNANYTVGRRNIPKLSEITEVSQDECYEFYNYTQSSLKQKVETALNRLRCRSLVIWSKCYTVVKRDGERNTLGEIKITKSDSSDSENPKKTGYFKYKEVHREATVVEASLILEIERKVMERHHWDNMADIFLTGNWKTFKSEVNYELQEQANIEYYYETYKIIFNVKDVTEYLLKNNELEVVETNLNENIKDMITTKADTSHKNATSKEYNGEQMSAKDWMRSDKDYIVGMEVLTDTVIDRNARDITDELKKSPKPLDVLSKSDGSNGDLPF